MVLYCTAKQAMLGNALNTCSEGSKTSKVTQLGFHFSLDAMLQQDSHTHYPEHSQSHRTSAAPSSVLPLHCQHQVSCQEPAREAAGRAAVQNLHMPFTSLTAIPRLTSVIQGATLNIEGKYIGTTENYFPPGLLGKCLIEGEDKDLTDKFFPLRWIGKTEFNVRSAELR